MTDPLKALVVDESTLARKEMAGALTSFVQLGSDGQLWLLPAFEELTSEKKVLCLLLAIKAAHMLELRDAEGASPGDLVAMSGMAAGTVRPKLSALVRRRVVQKDRSVYSLATPSARRVMAQLQEQSG